MTTPAVSGDDSPPGRSKRSVRPWLVLGVAFACGIAVGAAAVDKQRDAEAVRGDEAAVALLGVITDVDVTRSAYGIHVYNAGPLPVRLGSHRVVQPGEWSAVESHGKPPLCATQDVAPAEVAVPATATTAGGATREVALPLFDAYDALANARSSECDGVFHPERAVAIRQSATALNTDATVTLTLRVDTWARQPIEVVAVDPGPGLDIEVVDPLPVAVTKADDATVAVKVLRADCSTVLGRGHLTVTTRAGAATAAHEAWIRPTMPYQLIVDQCGARG